MEIKRAGLLGILYISLLLFITYLSMKFRFGQETAVKPILLFTGIFSAAGFAYLLLVRLTSQIKLSAWMITGALGLGLILRIIMMFSTPILETDYYRYLWDGAVTAGGMNPYRYSPDEAMSPENSTNSVLPELHALALEANGIIDRINYPRVRTIYPPVAQLGFAAAYMISHWSLLSWRFVLLVFDIITVILILRLLIRLRLPIIFVIIYWWNPLLIKELYNSAHMDVLVLPFVLGALLSSMSERYSLAAILLGIAIGVKVWPILLVTLFLRPIILQPRKCIIPLSLLAISVAVMAAPIYAGGIDHTSGFVAYSGSWEMNDSLFMVIFWLAKLVTANSGTAQVAARTITVISIIALVLWLSYRNIQDHADLVRKSLAVVAALFLISPTQFPWYFIWMLPFLALVPVMPLILLTALLPVYYMRYYFSTHGQTALFDYGIVWFEFVPVWFLLIRGCLITPLKLN